jgi:two-component system, NtrC family, sensor kinase
MSTATVEHPTSTAVDPSSISEALESEFISIDRQINYYRAGKNGEDPFPIEDLRSPRSCLTDINQEIELTLDDLQHHFLPEHISLVRDFGDLPRLEAYPRLLNQVWTNLVVNAAQSIGSSAGEVTVQTRVVNEMIRVSISDNGPGIAPECIGKIFDPFFTTKRGRDANGLGLAVSADIVRRHRGQINVINWPGEGARFIVAIPAR